MLAELGGNRLSVGTPLLTFGAIWSHEYGHQPGMRRPHRFTPTDVNAQDDDEAEHDHRDERAAVAEEPPADDLPLAEALGLLLLDADLGDGLVSRAASGA